MCKTPDNILQKKQLTDEDLTRLLEMFPEEKKAGVFFVPINGLTKKQITLLEILRGRNDISIRIEKKT